LGKDATFADLVRAARVAIRAGRKDSTAGCLITQGVNGFGLGADLMPALDELPDAPVELDGRLQRERDPVRVLTAWGQVGDAQPAIALAAFTTLGPESTRALGVALLLTDEGVQLRYSDAAASDADGPLPAQAAIERLLAAPHNADATLYVTAEAAIPLAQLVELLRLLPTDRTVALVLLLPQGTSVPARKTEASRQLCSDGLPEPAAGAVEGSLDSRAILAALGPLKSDAQSCLTTAQGQARAGGRLALALRIGEDGRVQEGCIQEDAIGDATLEACVMASARALRFPTPDPRGFVDVRLPLVLAPVGTPAQHALCE
jgi:hypothetical protein